MANDPPAEDRSVRGNTIKPERVVAKYAAVDAAPENDNDVTRQKELNTKADLGDDGIIESSQLPTASVYSVIGKLEITEEQTIPDSTTTKLDFGQETVSSSVVTPDLIDDTLNINEKGTYYIEAKYTWENSTNWSVGDLIINRILVNGSSAAVENKLKTGEEGETFTISSTAQLNSGDTVELNIGQYSGSDQVVSADNFSGDNHFTAVRLGRNDL